MKSRTEQEQQVTQQLRIVFKAIQAHSKRVEKTCGLSSIRLWMLHEVATKPGIKVTELATVLAIHRSTCSNMLDKLEDRGLINRVRPKTDQRTVNLHITSAGKALLAKAPSPPEGKLSSALNKLSADKLSQLEQSLIDLVEVLQFEDEQAGLTPIHAD